jgi:sulfite exporter TauE/SafE
LVNGILPCGFVYLALAGAATTQSSLQGALYMALFGLGTLPMMLFISLSGSIISLSARRWINRLSPYVGIAMAVLLIHRGVKMHREPESCCKAKKPAAAWLKGSSSAHR